MSSFSRFKPVSNPHSIFLNHWKISTFWTLSSLVFQGAHTTSFQTTLSNLSLHWTTQPPSSFVLPPGKPLYCGRWTALYPNLSFRVSSPPRTSYIILKSFHTDNSRKTVFWRHWRFSPKQYFITVNFLCHLLFHHQHVHKFFTQLWNTGSSRSKACLHVVGR